MDQLTIFKNDDKLWRYCIRGFNGAVLCVSKGYKNSDGARKSLKSLISVAKSVEEVVTLEGVKDKSLYEN